MESLPGQSWMVVPASIIRLCAEASSIVMYMLRTNLKPGSFQSRPTALRQAGRL